MTQAPAFVGCVPSWLVTKRSESVVQLNSPVGEPPSHSPSEVYSRCKLCFAQRHSHPDLLCLPQGPFQQWLLFFPCTSAALTSPKLPRRSTQRCARGVWAAGCSMLPAVPADRSSAFWATGHLLFSSFSRFLLNCAVLTALHYSFRILSFKTICF